MFIIFLIVNGSLYLGSTYSRLYLDVRFYIGFCSILAFGMLIGQTAKKTFGKRLVSQNKKVISIGQTAKKNCLINGLWTHIFSKKPIKITNISSWSNKSTKQDNIQLLK